LFHERFHSEKHHKMVYRVPILSMQLYYNYGQANKFWGNFLKWHTACTPSVHS